MAAIERLQVIDDLTGEVIDDYETVLWSVGSSRYEFDTTPERAAEFRDLMAPYLRASRQVTANGRAFTATVVAPTGRAARRVREWAAREGLVVPARGRIPEAVHAAFVAAHP
ncbi:MAG: Lsr2 family protein [Rhodococcus sp.]|nr:Lsr2 family protein [Rhodococcus sp. (in: high G+C Gram-positive bacteria)]